MEKTEIEKIIEIDETSIIEEFIEHFEELRNRELNSYLPIVVRFGGKFYSLLGTQCISKSGKVEVVVIEINKEVNMAKFLHHYGIYN